MIRILIALVCLCFHSILFSEEDKIERFSKNLETQEENSYLIDLQGMPTSMIAGCVNAITGNYSEGHLDLHVHGSNSLPLIRSYNSSKQDEGSLCRGWDINLPGEATLVLGEHKRQALVEHGGSSYNFEGRVNSDMTYLNENTYRYGVTNAHNGQLTAREKLKNTTFSYRRNQKFCKLTLHDNEKLEFDLVSRVGDPLMEFRLKTHFFPNRCHFHYSYSGLNLLKVESRGSTDQLIGSLKFIYPEKNKKRPQAVTTKDGRSVEYHYSKMDNGKYFLSKVNSLQFPPQSFEYSYDKKSEQVRLVKKILPDSRFIGVEYNEKGKYEIQGHPYIISGKNDSRFGRVARLKAPVGTDTSEIVTHSFIYHLNKDTVSSKPIGGSTEVFDAYGNRSVYRFSKEHRLEEIESYLSHGNLYRQEKIEWGTSGTDYTLLKKRSLFDAAGELRLERSYTYDKQGNSIQELITGDLTGEKKLSSFKKTFTYTKRAQVASENDGKKEIQYRYYSKTDLIQSKYLVVGSDIKQRVFFTYDMNGALTSEIVDDGKTKDENNLAGVTERRIKRIQPTKSLPVGFPEVIEELSLDLKTKKEILFRRTINTYSPEGHLLQQEVYDNEGALAYARSWAYNAMGKVTCEIDPLGQETLYDYDANGNCILKKVANDPFYISYAYDFSNRLIREEEVYDDGLRLAQTYSYDYRGNKISSIDIYGNTTQYVYDAFNRQIEIIHPPVVTADGALEHPIERMTYDVLNNVTSKTDGNGFTTYFSCSALGKPYLIEYPDGTSEKSVYNTDGTLRKLILPNGSYTLYEYDYQKRNTLEETYSPEGELLCRERKQYDAFHLVSQTDKNGNITTFEYDNLGRLISGKTGSMETRFVYDSLGRKSEVWELYANGCYKKSISVFDLLDRVIEERVEDHLGNLLSRKGTSYDSRGNKICETIYSTSGETTKITEYNSQNQPIKIIHPNGETSHIYHDFNYVDAWGNPVAYQDTVDPKGTRIVYIYNTQAKLAAEEYYSHDGRLLKKLSYRYDLSGNLVSRLEDLIEKDDIVDTIVTRLEYDSRNRELAIVKAYGRPEQKIFRKEYTYFDKQARQIKPDGVVIDYMYDYLGRLVEVCDTADTVHYVYSYDLNDNVLAVTDKISGTTTLREFDANDLLISETQDNGLKLQYQHDQLGRIQKLTLPDSSSISYEYDALNLRSISREKGLDVYTQAYRYDLSGRPYQIELPQNKGVVTYQYDRALRLKSILCDYFTQEIPEDGYDANNNILVSKQSDSKGAVSSSYAYDPLNQLIAEEGIASHTYEYDSRQNRTKKDDAVYENDVLSQLVRQGDVLYEHDPNGNRQNMRRPDLSLNCEYDAMDRLIKVTKAGYQVRYKYDAFNRRMGKAGYSLENGSWKNCFQERYLYSGETEIGSVSADGRIRELMLAAGTQPAMVEIRDKIYLPMMDHRGNITSLVDANEGGIVETYRYSSFGEEEIFDRNGERISDGLSPWRFSGKRVDPETGWVYFGRRYYDPEVGRWTTPDPLWFEDGPNLYAYVQNNPVIFVDPNGLKHRCVDQGGGSGKHLCFNHYEKVASILRWVLGPLGFFSNTKDDCSSTYTIEGKTSDKIALVHMNGIFNSKEDAMASAKMVSEMAGGCQVRGVYNCSYGVLDLFEAFINFFHVQTDPVRKLHQLWDEEFERMGENGIIIGISHSQGGIHYRNALESYDEERRKRIHLISVSPGAYTSTDICGSAVHIKSKWDFIPLFDFFGLFSNWESVISLPRDPNAPLFDHQFNSPTFDKELNMQLQKLIELHGGFQ